MPFPLSLFASLAESSLGLLALVLFACLAAAAEAGFHIGRRQARRHPDHKTREGVGTLVSGMLGLVAFSLGVTLSIAQSRHESRRVEVVQEANSIGTAWLRAKLVGGEAGEAIAAAVEDYARVRLDYTRLDQGGDERALIARAGAMQNAMWAQATQIARATPTAVAASLVGALNDMFDQSLTQRAAFESRVPHVLNAMLLCGSMLALGALGFQFGLGGSRPLTLGTLLLSMWVGAMVVIVDFNRPRLGFMRVDASPLVWTIEGFSSPPAAR
ncbi:hypothetical protein [Methylocella sp.]|uniref:bestrophin-like domain n=1 Tax=Methylocella sp. TaxID=1978226 RepID=UPI003783972A